jgi:hypothetical protein
MNPFNAIRQFLPDIRTERLTGLLYVRVGQFGFQAEAWCGFLDFQGWAFGREERDPQFREWAIRVGPWLLSVVRE